MNQLPNYAVMTWDATGTKVRKDMFTATLKQARELAWYAQRINKTFHYTIHKLNNNTQVSVGKER